jgi:HK97 family phage prohead protease
MTIARKPLPGFKRSGALERRTFATTLAVSDDAALHYVVEGYASVTGVRYSMGTYEEEIARGAFRDALAKPGLDVQLLANHENLPYARTTVPAGQPGHLSLSEDDTGLHFRAQLIREDADARALVSKIRSGLLDGASFAFRCISQSWSDDRSLRTILAADINRGDVSVCNQGANPAAAVSARSRHGDGNPAQTVDLILRDRASRVTRSSTHRDALVRSVVGRMRQGLPLGPLAKALKLSKKEVRWLSELERQR